jgi:hypothetical protein
MRPNCTPTPKKAEKYNIFILALVGIIISLCLITLYFCCYRAALPLSIDRNEAWNAWHSESLANLYPPDGELVPNNYPPLYPIILNAISSVGTEPLYAGRILSLLAALILSLLVFRSAHLLGAPRFAAGVGAIWFLATLAVAFTGYVGMNDPHLLALAVMCGGFVWVIAKEQRRQAVEPAIFVMAIAGFIKHSIFAIPASALVWLALDSLPRAARATAFGMAVCATGLLICRLAYGREFIEQLMFPRQITITNIYNALDYLRPLLAGIFVATCWLFLRRHTRLARKMAILLALTFANGFIQSFGAGVDVNAYFEFLFALAIGVGIAFGEAQNVSTILSINRNKIELALTSLLLISLVVQLRGDPYHLLLSNSFRSELADNVDTVRSEVERIRAIRGKISCSVMLICYWAGKPFVWDPFAVQQLVATGKWSQQEYERRVHESGIRFEAIDDRTEW